jgi:hypothetical protein
MKLNAPANVRRQFHGRDHGIDPFANRIAVQLIVRDQDFARLPMALKQV